MSSERSGAVDRVPVRADLAGLEPYGAPQIDVPVRLNTNETAEPPPPRFLAELRERLAGLELNRYPDRPHHVLRERLGQVVGIGPERVWAANGSNEILQQLFLAYGGHQRRALLFRPGYSMYPVIAQVTATPIVEHDLADGFVLTPEGARTAATVHDVDLIVLAHPNNPTGIPVDLDVVRTLHEHSRALLVVDEAYVEFGGTSAVTLLDELPRLVVVRTFSKAYRLAGLRLGYLFAHDWVVDDIRRVRLPYHLDTIKQLAAVTALDMREDFLEHRERTAAERARVAAALADLAEVEVFPSVANFLLFRVLDAARVFQELLDRGVLIRDFSTKPRLAGCLRVTIGTPAENDAFLEALRDVLAST